MDSTLGFAEGKLELLNIFNIVKFLVRYNMKYPRFIGSYKALTYDRNPLK